MQDFWISGTFGAALVILGGVLLAAHRRAWAAHQQDDALDDNDRHHFRRQFYRRLQASGMLVLIGVLIPLGDLCVPWQRFKVAFAIYWLSVLLIAAWIMLLAGLDWLSTRV